MSDISLPSPAFGAASTPPRRPWYSWRRIGLNFLTISILAHFIFGAGATYIIVQRIQAKRKQTFAGPAAGPTAPTRALEHKVQMQKKQATMSAPAPTKRVTTTSNVKVALPAMPAMPAVDQQVVPLAMAGMGGTGAGLGMGGGGGGTGGGGGGGLTLFGLRGKSTGTGLAGTFYDLKQTPDRQPIPSMAASIDPGGMQIGSPANIEYGKVIGNFIRGGVHENTLTQYFKGPNTVYARQWFIPTMSADNGPEAFNLQDQVQPKRWIVVYHGTVTPPVGGGYRFVGWADDIMAVVLNKRVVLDGCIHNFSGLRSKTEYHYASINAPMFVGDQTNVQEGEAYPIEVVIGEHPGGEFNAFLMIEKVGEKYEKSAKGSPILPVFKVGPIQTPPGEGRAPETAPDTPWSVWNGKPEMATSEF